MNEKLLIKGCSRKDRKYQKAFFDLFYKTIFRLANRYMSNHHDAEDILLVVFNKALKNIDHFEYRGEGSLKKWLNTIAINECIRALKKVRPIHYKEEPFEEAFITVNTPELDIEMIYKILRKMPEGYRTVFNLFAIEGYTHSEIAETLNISRNTSKSQLLKARKFIIRELPGWKGV